MPWKSRRQERSAGYRAAEVLLGLAAVFAPLALGGAPVWAALVAFALVAGAGLLLLPTSFRSPAAPLVGLGALALAAWSALRLVPGLGDTLAGAASVGALPLELGNSLAGRPGTLHLAPGAGARETLYLITAGLAAAVAHMLASRRSAAAGRMLRWILAGGVLVTLVGYLDLALGLDSVAGLYRPQEAVAPTRFFSTLLNPNHLGGYLLLVAGVAAATRSEETTALEDGLLFLLILGAGVGVLLTLSRGAIACGLALAVFLALYEWLQRRRRTSRDKTIPASRIALGAVAAMLVATVAFGLGDRLSQELQLGSARGPMGGEGKLLVWSTALQVIESHPLAGVGAGAFPDAAAPLQKATPDLVLTHVENLPLQIVVDHGLVAGGLALLLGLWILWKLARSTGGERGPTALLATLVAVLAQNLVDFNLMLAGVGIPFAIALGVLSARSRSLDLRAPGRGAWLAGLLVLGAVLVLPAWRGDRRRTFADFERLAGKASTLDDPLQAGLLRYPRSGELLAMAATVVDRGEGLGASLPLYAAAQRLGPTRYYPAVAAAGAYQRAGRAEEAARAYAAVCRNDRGLWSRRQRWAEQLLRLPNGRAVVGKLARIDADCLEPALVLSWRAGRKEATRDLAAVALSEGEPTPRIRYWHGRAAMGTGQPKVASHESALLIGTYTDRPEGYVLEGLLRLGGDPKLAGHLFEQAARLDAKWDKPVYLWTEATIRSKDEDGFRRALRHLMNLAGDAGRKRARAASLKGRFAMAMGDPEKALRWFRQARTLVLGQPSLRLDYLRALVALGRFRSASRHCAAIESWPEPLRKTVAELCRPVLEAGPEKKAGAREL